MYMITLMLKKKNSNIKPEGKIVNYGALLSFKIIFRDNFYLYVLYVVQVFYNNHKHFCNLSGIKKAPFMTHTLSPFF